MPRGQVDPKVVPRYAGLATYGRLPRLEDVGGAQIAVLGIPFDTSVTYRPGARFGPAHVRESSRLIRPYNAELDIFPFARTQVVDAGDVACTPFSIEDAIAAIEYRADELTSAGTRPAVIGGDHTVALPMLRALHRRHGPIAVVHFDAHLDTWDSYFGAAYTHGTPFRRASEEGLIDREASLHVGIRGPLYAGSDLVDDTALGFARITCPQIEIDGMSAALERMHARLAQRPIYVSVDIDVLDPAHAPGTGTPEIGGLTSRELLTFLRQLASYQIVGVDVVEVAPAYDHAQLTGIAAANIIYELVCLMAGNVEGVGT
ncbi:agmatinase [Mycobacterium sp.]|uniref:agmatinase n=1 Tax=Mycobacterium sp. TaxID=1785 RepID=UPI003BA8B4EF